MMAPQNTQFRVRIVIESRRERDGSKTDWKQISEYEVAPTASYVDALTVVDRAKGKDLTAKEAEAKSWEAVRYNQRFFDNDASPGREEAKQPFSGGGWPA